MSDSDRATNGSQELAMYSDKKAAVRVYDPLCALAYDNQLANNHDQEAHAPPANTQPDGVQVYKVFVVI